MEIPFHPIPNFLQRVYPRIGPIRAITEDKSNFKRHTAAKQYRIDVAERKRGPQWRVPLGQMTRQFVIFQHFSRSTRFTYLRTASKLKICRKSGKSAVEHRFLQLNIHFAAFFEIYRMILDTLADFF